MSTASTLTAAQKSIVEKLTAAEVSAASIDALTKAALLSEKRLGKVTVEQLVAAGVVVGDAVEIKTAFPSETTATPGPNASVTIPTTITAVLAEPSKPTAEGVLKALKAGQKGAVDGALAFFGRDAKTLVPTGTGELDVEATLEYLEFKATSGSATTRFNNSKKQFVSLVSVGDLTSKTIKVNPLTGRPMVPGEALSELNDEQLLALAFALEIKRAIPGDVDTLVENIKRNTSTWREVSADLVAHRARKSREFQNAEARLVTTR